MRVAPAASQSSPRPWGRRARRRGRRGAREGWRQRWRQRWRLGWRPAWMVMESVLTMVPGLALILARSLKG